MMMTDADMQAYYFKSITSWAAVPIDNSELVEVPIEKGAETQGFFQLRGDQLQKKEKLVNF